MKRIKHLGRDIKYAAGIFLTLHCLLLTVVAAGNTKVMQTYTGESEITIYVKGVEEDFAGAAVQIGTAECKAVASGRLSELRHPVKTLVMIDNSLSIPEPARAANAQILQNIISDRETYEQVAIATFDEEIRYLTEYTSDYSTLKAAVDNISYQDLKTRLTDVLYGLLSDESLKSMGDVYCRIVVLSDGVDSKSANCTKNELESRIAERKIPIYTLGIGRDEAQLGEMFALSRLSNGDSFKLEGMENFMDINAALNADRDIVMFTISPQRELLDGSRKMIKITFAPGDSLSVEAAMPQQTQPAEEDLTEPEPKMESVTETKPEHEMETAAESTVEETTERTEIMPSTSVVPFIAAVILVVIVIALLWICRGRKKSVDQEEALSRDSGGNQSEEREERRETIIQQKPEEPGPDTDTLLLFRNHETFDIILTDMDSPVRTFMFPLKNEASIGASAGCDIKITNDDYLSGKHCKIRVWNGKFYLEDTRSKNGTYLNGMEISSETEIVPGDIIEIGETRLRFDVDK